MTEPPTITELSHKVAASLKQERSEENAGDSYDLCEEIIQRHDLVRDDLMRETLRGWIGKVQVHHGTDNTYTRDWVR